MLGIASLVGIVAASTTAWAQAEPSAPAPTAGTTCAELTTRVADLEAYVTNGTPKALVSSGPGHANLADVVGKTLWLEQLKAMGVTLALSIGGTVVIAPAVKRFIGLRPDPEVEEDGLDVVEHREAGYHVDEDGGLAKAHAFPAATAGMAAAESASER